MFHVQVVIVTTESDTVDRTISHTQCPHRYCYVYCSNTPGKCAPICALNRMVSAAPTPNYSFSCIASCARAFGLTGLNLIPLF